MKHIKLFEGWGDPINRKKSKLVLIQKNHYLTQERSVGFYNSMERATTAFLNKFKEFINEDWNGVPKNYFIEWDQNVENSNTWDEFFAQKHNIGEGTFYLESDQPGSRLMIYDEMDLLLMVYSKDPAYLESFLPFAG